MKILIYIFISLLIIVFLLLIVVITLLLRNKRASVVLKNLHEQTHTINSLQYKRQLMLLKPLINNPLYKQKYDAFLSEYKRIKKDIVINITKGVRDAEELLNKNKIYQFFKLSKILKAKLKILEEQIITMINITEEVTKDVNEYHQKLIKFQNYYETIRNYYSDNFLFFESIDVDIKSFFLKIDNIFSKLNQYDKESKFSEINNELSENLKPAILYLVGLFINFPKLYNIVNFILPKKYSEVEQKYYELIKSGCKLKNLNFPAFKEVYQNSYSLLQKHLKNLQYKKTQVELNKIISQINEVYSIISNEEKYFQNLSSTIVSITHLFNKIQNQKIKFNNIFTEYTKNYETTKDEALFLEDVENKWVHIKTMYSQIQNIYKNQQHMNVVWTSFYEMVKSLNDNIKTLNTKLKEGIVFYKQRKSILDYQNEFIQLRQLITFINSKSRDKNFESFFKQNTHNINKIHKNIRDFLVYLGKKPTLNEKKISEINNLKEEINKVYSNFVIYNDSYKEATKLMMKAAGLRDRNKQIQLKLPQLEILYATNQYKEVIYVIKSILKL